MERGYEFRVPVCRYAWKGVTAKPPSKLEYEEALAAHDLFMWVLPFYVLDSSTFFMLNFSLVISWMLRNEVLASVKQFKFLLESATLQGS